MKNLLPTLFAIGAVCALLSAAVYITHWSWAPYTYLAGAVVAAVSQIAMQPRSDNFVVRRLYRQQTFGALFLVVAGVLMLYTHGNEWILCLLVAAILELYSSFRISQEEKKNHQS